MWLVIIKKSVILHRLFRKDAGVDDRGGLENRCTAIRTQGSNPCLSAIGCDFGRNFFLFIGIVNHICRPTSDSGLYTFPTAGRIVGKRDNTRRHRLHEKAALPHLMPDIPVCRLCFRRFRYKYLQNSSSSEECRNFALAS